MQSLRMLCIVILGILATSSRAVEISTAILAAKPPPAKPSPSPASPASPPPSGTIGLVDPKAVFQVKFLNASDGRYFNGMTVPLYPATRPSDSMVFKYKVNIPSGFRVGMGGTLPGILAGGDECPIEAAGYTCWSVQLAWQADGGGKVIAHLPRTEQNPVLQLPSTQLGDGDAVAIRGPKFNWKLDAWNFVQIRLQLNTPGRQNGVLRVTVNNVEVVRVQGLVFRLTSDLGVDAALLEIAHSGGVPRSPGGVAQYVLLRTVQMYDVAPVAVQGISQALPQKPTNSASSDVGAREAVLSASRHSSMSDASVSVMPSTKIPPPLPKGLKRPPSKKPPVKKPPPPPKRRSPPPAPSKKPRSPPPKAPKKPPASPRLSPSPSPSPAGAQNRTNSPPAPFVWQDLTSDQIRRAMSLTSIFENANTTLQYNYCENINDGRGYTFGFCGFTTAYDDGLAVVQAYQTLQPVNNTLAKYVSPMIQLSKRGSGNVTTLPGFCEAIAVAATDPLFRSAQESIQKTWYYQPSVAWSRKLGITYPLVKAQLYDAMVNHGEGEGDPFSIDFIVANATATLGGTPLQGVDEQAWFRAFLTARKDTLIRSGDAVSTRRIDYYTKLADGGNWQLSGPIFVDLQLRPTGWTINDVYYGEFEIYDMKPGHRLRVIK